MEESQILVETLKLLSLEDFARFRTLAEAEPSLVTCSLLEAANVQDVVDLMLQTSSGECVEAVRTVLAKMDRLDLVQRLSKDKFSVEEERLSLDQRVEKLINDINLMLETLKDLNDEEFMEFKRKMSSFNNFRSTISHQQIQLDTSDQQESVISILRTHGKESIKVTRDVLESIRRTDLVQRMSSSSASTEMLLGKQSDLIHEVATMAAVKDVLLETLQDLNETEFIELKLLLQFANFQRNIPLISWDELDDTNRARVVDHLVNKCGKLSVEVIREVLLDLNRTDLALVLPETSSASKRNFVWS
ncbi:uncharacterized protein LOC129380003 [Poeciliopsis prolifica]|uniref:uncharacterized protein LOC129380003 n=1 Tax=Poeciliopsis prolifica TaxID=188132 RepID=UPI0024141ECD|nr:uncharacterized protein LOC129380003 [Poeciliopsis prolifica]